jgi:hypothetical protein
LWSRKGYYYCVCCNENARKREYRLSVHEVIRIAEMAEKKCISSIVNPIDGKTYFDLEDARAPRHIASFLLHGLNVDEPDYGGKNGRV